MTITFRLGKIPVRILPSFFIAVVLLNVVGSIELTALLVWVAVVLVSVLFHELGHATVGLAFGLEPRIELHGMGGTTSWAAAQKLSTAQRVAISLAGPVAGFVAGALVFALYPHVENPLAALVYSDLMWVNVAWGVFNLLPMLPLDGGSVVMHVLNAATHGRGERPARIVSLVVAGVAAAGALLWLGLRAWWPILLSLSFVATNWRGLKDLRTRELDAPMRESLDRAYAALDARDGARVLELARPIALEAHTPPVRAEALQLVAFGFLLEGRVADADAAIAAMPPGFAPHASLRRMRAEAGAPIYGAGSAS